ncbi:MAG: hypothetical protein NW204_06355 [Xanthomonadaceae bacterium]|nr:hypothetical protein [Xanthomonadaceae bacterium]
MAQHADVRVGRRGLHSSLASLLAFNKIRLDNVAADDLVLGL